MRRNAEGGFRFASTCDQVIRASIPFEVQLLAAAFDKLRKSRPTRHRLTIHSFEKLRGGAALECCSVRKCYGLKHRVRVVEETRWIWNPPGCVRGGSNPLGVGGTLREEIA